MGYIGLARKCTHAMDIFYTYTGHKLHTQNSVIQIKVIFVISYIIYKLYLNICYSIIIRVISDTHSFILRGHKL